MENIIKMYPSSEAVEWVDKLDDGWFKNKDEFIHDYYKSIQRR